MRLVEVKKVNFRTLVEVPMRKVSIGDVYSVNGHVVNEN